MGTLVESLSTPPAESLPETDGTSEGENIHMDGALSDWTVSMDQLAALAPGVRSAALVVSWFGTDLRCGECLVRPAVENRGKVTTPHVWSVAGLDRASAPVMSQVDGAPVYGGTPNDGSVIRAIRDLRERGIDCMYYPFVMMDVLPGNGLPDPYGRDEQPPFPWRGRITCHPAPGMDGSPDGTAEAAAQVAAFMGAASPDDFALSASGDAVVYSGPDEWRFRRFILHQAWLCRAAGGVESFLIGSELRGLTTIRDGVGSYPFVRELIRLAADVRAILPEAKIGYAADWSEYFGHHLPGGELFFHLDPLWADANIDFIGIDNYMPLSDWRDGMDHLDARAGWTGVHDIEYLKSNIAGGEGYDWYYASRADRDAQRRTPIADGAYGEDWVWRYKDLVNWWSNPHHDRPGGLRDNLLGAAGADPSAWTSVSGATISPSDRGAWGPFAAPAAVASGGVRWSSAQAGALLLEAGARLVVTAFVAAGTSGRWRMTLASGTHLFVRASFGGEPDVTEGSHALNDLRQEELSPGLWRITMDVTVGPDGWGGFRVGPDSATAGEDIVVHGLDVQLHGVSTTPWVPRSKPIRFTEYGCPAVDKGPNQPNVFYDPKSSESALPYYSDGRRDDAVQRQYLAAHLEYWNAPGPHNPVSEIYGGTMVDTARMYVWAWDARPWPAWPALSDVWNDGANHEFGHWLNGRLGGAPVGEILRAVLEDHGFDAWEAEDIGHMVTGLTVGSVSSARAVIEPLASMFAFDAVQSGGRIAFRLRRRRAAAEIPAELMVETGENDPLHTVVRAQETELPAVMRVDYLDAENEHRSAVAEIRWPRTASSREETVRAEIAMRQSVALERAHCMLAEARAGRETLELSLPPSMLHLEPGDVVEALGRTWRIDRLTDGLSRRAQLVSRDDAAYRAPAMPSRGSAAVSLPQAFGAPALLMLDTTLLRESDDPWSPWMAAHASPWPGEIAVMRQVAGQWRTTTSLSVAAAVGRLLEPLPAGPQWVWDRGNAIVAHMWSGTPASVTEEALFAGANAAAVGDPWNGWEIVQFRDAELLAPGVWRLSMLLRGQRGSDPELAPERPAGAFVVMLDGALSPLALDVGLKGTDLTLRGGPAGRDMTDASWTEVVAPYRARAARPFAPVHLRGARDAATGDVVLTWIRRTRTGGDAWTETEPPLGETFERYRVELRDAASGATLRTMDVDAPEARWTAAERAADQPDGPAPVAVRVAQIGETYGPGAWTEEIIDV